MKYIYHLKRHHCDWWNGEYDDTWKSFAYIKDSLSENSEDNS